MATDDSTERITIQDDGIGTGILAKQVKPLLPTQAFHIGMLFRVLPVLLTIQFPANESGKAEITQVPGSLSLCER